MIDMKIRKLSLTNFRKFEQQDFILNDQMNVFAGKNGSGKTAVLEAATVMLGAYLAAYKKLVPSRFVHNISTDDARLKSQNPRGVHSLLLGDVRQFPCKVSCEMQWEQNQVIEFQRILPKKGGRTKFEGSNPMQPVVIGWEKRIAKADYSDADIILPIVLYLSSARLWNESHFSRYSGGTYSRTDGYHRCLDDRHGVELAFQYIDMLKAASLEQNDGQPLPAYTAILQAVNASMKDELQPGEQAIFSSRFENDILALKTKEGTLIPFRNLSDGYRNVIRIVLDIAARMCILNPYLQEKALRETPGIVVIDELDLSLHPTWQKRIIQILKDLFPKVQFLCATHSPFIIQSLEEGELITLDHDLDSEYSGESIEDIAEDVMGVEMPQYSEKKIKMYEAAKRYFEALNSGKSKEDVEQLRLEMATLEAEYSDNPAYLALMRQALIKKEVEVDTDATGQ